MFDHAPLLSNDDSLDTILSLCDLPSVAAVARCCRRAASFVAEADRPFWRSHLVSVLAIPPAAAHHVRLAEGQCAKSLLAGACGSVGVGVDVSENEDDRYEWDTDEKAISVAAMGWGSYQIGYAVDGASTWAGHDFATRYHRPVPCAPSTVVRRRIGSNLLDVGISSTSYFEIQLVERNGEQQQQHNSNQNNGESNRGDVARPCVAIGLSTKDFFLSGRQPGWTSNSVGFHSDDGCLFFGEGTDTCNFGPSFGDGDTVGCGFHAGTQSLFFTKNGSLIGTAFAFSDALKHVYPTIGMDSNTFSVHLNFGMAAPFLFDLSIAERLYDMAAPVTDLSWAERLNYDNRRSSRSELLESLGITCIYKEAVLYHPWNANAETRAVLLEDEESWAQTEDEIGMLEEEMETLEEDLVDADYSSRDDSTFGSDDYIDDNGNGYG